MLDLFKIFKKKENTEIDASLQKRKKVSKKCSLTSIDKELMLMELVYAARTLNNFIRRNADEGFIDVVTVSLHEVEELHKMRRLLAKYFNEPLYNFENKSWYMKKVIEGKSFPDELVVNDVADVVVSCIDDEEKQQVNSHINDENVLL